MISYLSKVFGTCIRSEKYSFPAGTPFFLVSGYEVEKLVMHSSECVLITPRDSSARLPVLKKHYERIAEICGLPCALNLEKLTSNQRENLISCNIPFISGRQIYLPFWGSVFSVKMKPPGNAPRFMTPAAQLVFLSIFYREADGAKVNSSALSAELGLPKSSVSGAVHELITHKLIYVTQAGTSKWISLAKSPDSVLRDAVALMRNPKEKEIYLKTVPADVSYKLGGVRGLAEISMLAGNSRDGALVYDRRAAKRIQGDLLISKRDFDDFGGYAAEIWRYNPALLSQRQVVDDISLLMNLQENEDERVQKELDTIRIKYGLAVEE